MKVQEIFHLNQNFSNFEVISGNEYLNNSIKNIKIINVPHENIQFNKGDFVIISLDIIIKEK